MHYTILLTLPLMPSQKVPTCFPLLCQNPNAHKCALLAEVSIQRVEAEMLQRWHQACVANGHHESCMLHSLPETSDDIIMRSP